MSASREESLFSVRVQTVAARLRASEGLGNKRGQVSLLR